MKPIKVLQLVSPALGGIEAYVFEHFRHMDRTRFQFDFLTRNPDLEHAPQYQSLPYHVWLLQRTAAQDKDSFIRQIREIYSKGYDVLHLNTCFWTGFLLEELAQEAEIRKIIIHAHSSFIDEQDERKREELFRRHEEVKRAFRPDLATDFWACSQAAADWLFGSQISRDKIRIMKNAIEIERFQFNRTIREQIRLELGVDDKTLVLGTVGRLSYQKNQLFLIDVFAEFYQKHPNSKLLLIGDGELRGELEKQISRKGLEKNILLLGWKSNVAEYLQAMDCFLLTSRFEGFPIAAVEAVASGLPCVVSDQVSKDTTFKGKLQYIPLCASTWLDVLDRQTYLPVDRSKGAVLVREAGYDIRRQAKVLEALYEL